MMDKADAEALRASGAARRRKVNRARAGKKRAASRSEQAARVQSTQKTSTPETSPTLPQLLRIQRLLVAKYTLEDCSEATGLKKSQIFRLARRLGFHGRKRAMSRKRKLELDRLILDGEKSITEIARQLSIHKSTVSRRRQLLMKRVTDKAGDFRPKEIAGPRKCDGCGSLVIIWPCVICAARAEREK